MLTKAQATELTGFRMEYDLNPVQEAALGPVFATDHHLLISAGTGCGKTVIYEWALYKALYSQRHAVVIAPNKALVEQKAAAWRRQSHPLSEFSLTVKTGDYLGVSAQDMINNPLKVMTPEAFAVALRGKSAITWLREVGLLVVDEIHLIGASTRGHSLEACIANFFTKQIAKQVRLIGLSASIDENSLHDLMQWISGLTPTNVHAIKSTWRPTPLIHTYHSYKHSQNYRTNEQNKLAAIVNVISSIHRPLLVFVHTKKMGYALVKALTKQGIETKFHCSDRTRGERAQIEEKFSNGSLRVVIATSTLAVGCDFPVEDVLIAGMHRGLNVVELDTLQQMAGRAGHQSACDRGVVHWIIPDQDPDMWKGYITGQYTIKSELVEHRWLAFHTIAEISSAGRTNRAMMTRWFEHTLAYVQKGHQPRLMETMFSYLLDAKAINTVDLSDGTDEECIYYATLLGQSSARFYFDPMDVYLWYSSLDELITRNHAKACNILAMGRTLVQDFQIKTSDFPDNFVMGSFSPAGAFLYYLATHLSGDKYQERENLPLRLKVPLYNFYKELQRVTACLTYIAQTDTQMLKPIEYLQDTVYKIIYGVPDECLALIRVKGLGQALVMKLYHAGLQSPEDVFYHKEKALKVLGPKRGEKIYALVEKVVNPIPF